jgi:hypothetical protein
LAGGLIVNEELSEFVHQLLGGNEEHILTEDRGQIESGAINELTQGIGQTQQRNGKTDETDERGIAEVEDTGDNTPKEKGAAAGESAKNDKYVEDKESTSSPTNNFSTELNFIRNDAGADVDNRDDHSNKMNEPESPLIDREEYEASATIKVRMVLDNESSADNGSHPELEEDHR